LEKRERREKKEKEREKTKKSVSVSVIALLNVPRFASDTFPPSLVDLVVEHKRLREHAATLEAAVRVHRLLSPSPFPSPSPYLSLSLPLFIKVSSSVSP
jgi:hypothetical protein